MYPQRKPLLLTDTRGKSVDLAVCGERNIGWRPGCIVLVSLKTPPPATLLPAKCHETSEIGKLIHIFSIDDNAADRPLSFHRIRIQRVGWGQDGYFLLLLLPTPRSVDSIRETARAFHQPWNVYRSNGNGRRIDEVFRRRGSTRQWRTINDFPLFCSPCSCFPFQNRNVNGCLRAERVSAEWDRERESGYSHVYDFRNNFYRNII